MALGKSVGRVSIRVVPDATKFRNDLRLVLKRAEQSMSANLAVTADTRPFDVELRKLVKDWSGKEVKLDVDAVTAGASAHIRAITRPRKATIVVDADVKRAAAKIGGFLATFSGVKAGSKVLRDLGETFTSTLENLPRIALLSTTILGLGAAGLNAVHGIGAAAVGLAQLVPLAALLPGALAGSALGIVTLVLAFKTMPPAVRAAGVAYKSLQGIVGRNFWTEAAKPIRSFLTGILPDLKVGFAGLAGAIGSSLGGIAADLQNTLGGGVLGAVFDDITGGVKAATPGLLAFSDSFVSLLAFGAQYLPTFGGWVTRIGQQFTNWLAGAEASGQLDQMAHVAIATLGQLGSILGSVGSILAGVFTAGGGGGIAALASGLAAVAAVVNTPAFQTTLATIFAGAGQGAAGLAAALAPIGSMLQTIAPTIATILTGAGQALGGLLANLAAAIATPAFQTGLSAFFSGIEQGLAAIGPSLPALASAFGALGSFAGQLAAQLGPVLGTVFSALAPVVVQLLSALEPLLPVLGQALIGAVQSVAPLLSGIATTVLPPLIDAFTTLIPAIQPLLDAVMPILLALLPPIAAIFSELAPIISAVFQAITPLIQALGPVLLPIIEALTPLLQLMAPVWQILGDVIGIFASVVGAVITTLVDLLTGNFADIGKVWSDVWDGIQQKFTDIGNAITGTGQGVFNGFMGLVQGFVNGMIDNLNILIGAINSSLDGLKSLTGGVINLHIGKIPHVALPKLATGADILPSKGGTAFIGGEGGDPETVVNRGMQNRLLKLTAELAKRALAAGSGASGSGGGDTYQIHTDDPFGTALAIVRFQQAREA